MPAFGLNEYLLFVRHLLFAEGLELEVGGKQEVATPLVLVFFSFQRKK